jgi:hypothetical protein
MANINALKASFFVNLGDVVQANSDPAGPDVAVTAGTRPQTDRDTKATYLIDGENYFGAIKDEIKKLLIGGVDRFFYTAGWQVGLSDAPDTAAIGEGSVTSAWSDAVMPGIATLPAFELQTAAGPPYTKMIDDVKAMAAAGVDVRVLPWATPLLVNFQQAQQNAQQPWAVNLHSLQTALDLALRIRQHLAVLGGDQSRQLVTMTIEQLLETEHHPRPTDRRRRSPAGKRGMRRSHRVINGIGISQRNAPGNRAGGRVEDISLATAGRRRERCAVDPVTHAGRLEQGSGWADL